MSEARGEDGGTGRAPRMDRARIVRELAGQGAYCRGRSPLYAAVLGALTEDGAAGAPWPAAVEAAWRGRPFVVGWEAPHLLLACMHHFALRGSARELAAVYPSCGGSGGDPGAAAKAFLRRAPAEFWEMLRGSFVQTNEVDRSIGWMLVAAAVFSPRGLPFRLVELGASAGLNLIGDHLRHECRFVPEPGAACPPLPRLDGVPYRATARAGLDLRPRRLSDPSDRLWLRACVWADDLPRLARLERAVSMFLRLQSEREGPRLTRLRFADAPDWLAAAAPARDGEGLIVFNSIATIYLADAEYEALRRGMARVLAAWRGRAYWVELERARGAADGPLELRVHRPAGGRLATRVLGSSPPRPTEMRLRGGWEFLQ